MEEAEEVTLHYLDALDRIQAAGLDAHISVKPTQLGLDLDKELCFRQSAAPGGPRRRAQELRLDRHGELAVRRRDARALPADARAVTAHRHRAAGVPVSHRKRTSSRWCRSGPPSGWSRARISSRPSVAFPRKADVDENFYTLACRLLREDARNAGGLLHIATHDPRLADRLAAFIDEHGVPKSAYEYAMLYGIQRPLQQRLVQAGRPLRVLVAYGEYWFPWYMRRLAERPANVWFVVKNVFR